MVTKSEGDFGTAVGHIVPRTRFNSLGHGHRFIKWIAHAVEGAFGIDLLQITRKALEILSFFFLYHHAHVAIQNMAQVAGAIFSDSFILASKHYLPDRIGPAPSSVRTGDICPGGSRKAKHAVVLSQSNTI